MQRAELGSQAGGAGRAAAPVQTVSGQSQSSIVTAVRWQGGPGSTARPSAAHSRILSVSPSHSASAAPLAV